MKYKIIPSAVIYPYFRTTAVDGVKIYILVALIFWNLVFDVKCF